MSEFKILEVFNSISTEKRKPDNEFGIGSFPQNYDTSVWYCTKVLRVSDSITFIKDYTETDKGKVIGFKFFGDFENKQCFVKTTLGDYEISDLQECKLYNQDDVEYLINLLKSTTEYEVLQSFRDKVEQFKNK